QVGVVGLGAVDVHVPAANGGPGVDGEVPSVGTVFDAEVAGGGGGDLDDGLGEVPGDEDRPGPGDGELLDGDLLDRRAQVLGVLEVDPGEDGHVGVDDVGGVQATAQAHLDHRRVDRLIGEEGEGRRSRQLEIGEPDPLVALLEDVGESRHVGHRLGELLGCGVAAQDAEPFFDRYEMGGYVRPGVQPVGEQEQSRNPGGRRLPVGAGHVDD